MISKTSVHYKIAKLVPSTVPTLAIFGCFNKKTGQGEIWVLKVHAWGQFIGISREAENANGLDLCLIPFVRNFCGRLEPADSEQFVGVCEEEFFDRARWQRALIMGSDCNVAEQRFVFKTETVSEYDDPNRDRHEDSLSITEVCRDPFGPEYLK